MKGRVDPEVVLELLGVVRAPHVHLSAREQALHRVGHHVLGGVADHLAGRGVAIGHDLERDVAL